MTSNCARLLEILRNITREDARETLDLLESYGPDIAGFLSEYEKRRTLLQQDNAHTSAFEQFNFNTEVSQMQAVELIGDILPLHDR